MISQKVLPVDPAQRRESIDSVLAKNLVAARVIRGLTQHELAEAAGISRATIAQLETGFSDPRLSTVVDISRALGIAPIVLLAGVPEVKAFAEITHQTEFQPLVIAATDLERMLDYTSSGMLKDRVRAARLGAAIARRGTEVSPSIAVTAGLFSASFPGTGTSAGAELGRLLE
jgi:transcriptional regulator with XRE-family HTH domain